VKIQGPEPDTGPYLGDVIMEVKLVVVEGKHKDRVIPLPETIFLIGRDRQCHIRPHCQLVSQLHCAIAAWAGKVRVRDLQSRNGTFINGKPIHGEVVVKDGDQLQIGSLIFNFCIKEDGVPVPAPIQDEGEVAWLLETSGDSAVLGAATHVLPAPHDADESEEAGTPDELQQASGSKVISAGEHLHTYLKVRKKPAAKPANPNGSPNGSLRSKP
jgi:pSer/pThr/pTyr-binding forkhead associated (FHA) protein